ncbi:MAG: branched-chain alpha-keto acid dehydrogenase subunit E2 [Gammaproteobacteria bacterium]|nr:branched-chain alpha-keto acid dehydrogenase subunit E2 [Gammaproteobacteria bacterium]MCP4091048.1 branched-chain alpha-keto acid dehydrogenase subunit E2 [Gammaproteobacteria bacterium]MCP4277426.1 branched-chain alpha-keto acid dehydrogenase subunit E2 [Gammaproteobacteria bacterium]MCP4831513.1 branched-chain alpha-keto acid dehydrogenase subunit E2 [Gammaproteobacteria bacterium]MCP4927736.1 branched-chain alpha-keto acid dehydrogenase subunit E2 [Gammaproteobacteria bacterium]
MTTRQEVLVPDIGDFDAVEIVEVMVAVGDNVAAEDSLITLETDKAAMDVPAPIAGKVLEMSVSLGDKVSEGSLILVLEAAEVVEAAPAEISATATPAVATGADPVASPVAESSSQSGPDTKSVRTTTPTALPPINEAGFAIAHASPSIRKFARELGVDLSRVQGSGPKQRIVPEDIKAFVKAIMTGQLAAASGPALPEVPVVDFAKFGAVEEKPLGRIQKISGPRLHASWVNLPHVTQNDEADITDMEAQRQALKARAAEKGVKLTPLAFAIRACVQALEEFPVFNTSMGPDNKTLIWKQYTHIGFAADTPNGLVVPVIRDADKKDVFELAAALADLSGRAREGKLKVEEMQGGTFTVSSLGGIGGTAFTPIINAPEVAILGMPRSKMQPVWNGEEFVPRLIQPLCLSYDHRVIDGATGVRFTTYLAARLGDAEGLIGRRRDD